MITFQEALQECRVEGRRVVLFGSTNETCEHINHASKMFFDAMREPAEQVAERVRKFSKSLSEANKLDFK